MEPSTKKIGKIRTGFRIGRMSLRVVRANKKLMAIPVITTTFSMFMVFAVALVAVAIALTTQINSASTSLSQTNPTVNLAWFVGFALIFGIINTFIEATMLRSALDVFKGNPVSIRGSIRQVLKHKKSLFGLGAINGSVGTIVRAVEERVPFVGKIIINLLGASWTVLSYFSIPFILEENSKPIKSTKQSFGLIKQIWGAGSVSLATVGLFWLAIFGAYIIASGVLFAAGASLSHAFNNGHPIVAVFSILGLLWAIGFIMVISLSVALSAVVKAALFHYATTGEAPEQFNKEALKAAMTPKKARRLFA